MLLGAKDKNEEAPLPGRWLAQYTKTNFQYLFLSVQQAASTDFLLFVKNKIPRTQTLYEDLDGVIWILDD